MKTKLFALMSAAAALSVSSLAFGLGGGASGFLFNYAAGDLECVSTDGSIAPALKNTITLNDGEVNLDLWQINIGSPVHHFILSQGGSVVRAPLALVDGADQVVLAQAPFATGNFGVVTESDLALIANANALFAKPTKVVSLDKDTYEMELNVSAQGLCQDTAAKVRVLLAN